MKIHLELNFTRTFVQLQAKGTQILLFGLNQVLKSEVRIRKSFPESTNQEQLKSRNYVKI